MVSNVSYDAIFNPTTVEELISDIQTANTSGEDDVINLVPNGVYTITGNGPGVPFSGSSDNGLPPILADGGNSLTINGNGAIIERDPNLFTDPDDPCSGSGEKFRIFDIKRV